ncbi:Hypothetical_protein [Hexamita inflata]|uniref:Hypothetical_protein n=1 Tax=Hexamita inflata TaxID=28002 RepID=A0ABP1KH29_9EUKA
MHIEFRPLQCQLENVLRNSQIHLIRYYLTQNRRLVYNHGFTYQFVLGFQLFVGGVLLFYSFTNSSYEELNFYSTTLGAISLIREQVNSLIREFHHAKLPYKQIGYSLTSKVMQYDSEQDNNCEQQQKTKIMQQQVHCVE